MLREGLGLVVLLACSACSLPGSLPSPSSLQDEMLQPVPGISSPGGFSLSAAIEDDASVPRVLWLERAALEVPTAVDRELVETAFTYNLARLLRQKQIFTAVKIYEGSAAPDDWVARIRIDRASERSQVPLATIAASVFTLGIYTIVGRLRQLDFEMGGRLEIRDARGELLGTGETSRTATLAVYRKNRTSAVSFFLDERTRLIEELLDIALVEAGAREP